MKRLLALALAAAPAAAQEFVDLPARVGDDDFYRAVACAAPPGGECAKPLIRWPKARRGDLTVSLVTVAPDLRPYQRRLHEAAIDDAIAQIGAAGAGLRLHRVEGPADIEVHILPTRPGAVIEGTGVPELDGNRLPLARVALRAREGRIRRGVIAISAEARRREIASVLLEELTQAMGLMTDIRGPAYRRSLFSEDGNSVTRLAGQDAMALRRHYSDDPEG